MLKSKVQIKGNVGQIEAQYTPQGKLVCKFSVGVNFGKNGNKDTDWYPCVAWENTAKLINDLVQVGTLVIVEGNQRLKKWEDKDGNKRVNIEVTVREFDVLARGKEREEREHDEDEPEFMRD